MQAPRGQDVQAPRSQDVQAPRSQDIQAPRSQDVQAPRSQDIQAPRSQDVQRPAQSGHPGAAEPGRAGPAQSGYPGAAQSGRAGPAQRGQGPRRCARECTKARERGRDSLQGRGCPAGGGERARGNELLKSVRTAILAERSRTPNRLTELPGPSSLARSTVPRGRRRDHERNSISEGSPSHSRGPHVDCREGPDAIATAEMGGTRAAERRRASSLESHGRTPGGPRHSTARAMRRSLSPKPGRRWLTSAKWLLLGRRPARRRRGRAGVLLLRPVTVTVADVTQRDIAPAIQGVGTVEAKVAVQVGSKITGRLVAVLVDQGDTVTAGQVLARLDDAQQRAEISPAGRRGARGGGRPSPKPRPMSGARNRRSTTWSPGPGRPRSRSCGSGSRARAPRGTWPRAIFAARRSCSPRS